MLEEIMPSELSATRCGESYSFHEVYCRQGYESTERNPGNSLVPMTDNSLMSAVDIALAIGFLETLTVKVSAGLGGHSAEVKSRSFFLVMAYILDATALL